MGTYGREKEKNEYYLALQNVGVKHLAVQCLFANKWANCQLLIDRSKQMFLTTGFQKVNELREQMATYLIKHFEKITLRRVGMLWG